MSVHVEGGATLGDVVKYLAPRGMALRNVSGSNCLLIWLNPWSCKWFWDWRRAKILNGSHMEKIDIGKNMKHSDRLECYLYFMHQMRKVFALLCTSRVRVYVGLCVCVSVYVCLCVCVSVCICA